MPVRMPRHIELARTPTPLLPLRRLSADLRDAQLWIKRDDLTGLELSGNKVRKLEFVIAAAQDAGCDTIVTEGAWQSNHCRATAAACARLGMHAHLLIRPRPPAPPQGNLLLDRLFGASIETFEQSEYATRQDRIVADQLEALRAAGRKPRFTPMGASEPIGCWGYIRAAAELAEQLAAAGVDACDVVVAVSSGGTYAGLLLGVQLFQLRHVTIWGVPVSDDVAHHTRNVTGLCQAVSESFQFPHAFDETQLRFIDGYVGEGYAVPYPEELAALRRLASREAILLDPVYTGKAFCALLDRVRDGALGRERPVVFWHTGGVFSDFAWPDVLLEG
ncbi:MAG: pyridoxal-phosphate dependent enzyme [Planctomycetota bacterium]|nr:MAG: pyridoxal-phosphate dependent enzyme [Planctomycetota bacterium]